MTTVIGFIWLNTGFFWAEGLTCSFLVQRDTLFNDYEIDVLASNNRNLYLRLLCSGVGLKGVVDPSSLPRIRVVAKKSRGESIFTRASSHRTANASSDSPTLSLGTRSSETSLKKRISSPFARTPVSTPTMPLKVVRRRNTSPLMSMAAIKGSGKSASERDILAEKPKDETSIMNSLPEDYQFPAESEVKGVTVKLRRGVSKEVADEMADIFRTIREDAVTEKGIGTEFDRISEIEEGSEKQESEYSEVESSEEVSGQEELSGQEEGVLKEEGGDVLKEEGGAVSKEDDSEEANSTDSKEQDILPIDLPETIQEHPETSQEHPETSQEHPETTQEHPETIQHPEEPDDALSTSTDNTLSTKAVNTPPSEEPRPLAERSSVRVSLTHSQSSRGISPDGFFIHGDSGIRFSHSELSLVQSGLIKTPDLSSDEWTVSSTNTRNSSRVDVASQQRGTLSLLHVQLRHLLVEDDEEDVAQYEQTEQDDGLQRDVTRLAEEHTERELRAPTERLPHLVVRHGGVALAVLAVEGLQNGRRLRLPHGVTRGDHHHHRQRQRQIGGVLGVVGNVVEDDEAEGGDLADEGDQAHHGARHPLLLHALAEEVRD